MDLLKLIRIALFAVLAAALLAGCGDDNDEPDEPPLNELARFAPADAAAITFVDLAGAREQLGLADDADALAFDELEDVDFDNPPPEAQLIEAAVLGMPPLTSFVETLDEDPAAAEFDGGAISAAVNTIGEGFPMTIIKTSQPYSEIADALTGLGYVEEGSALTKEGERFEQVADAGDGVIIIGNNGAPANAIAAEGEGPTALTDLLEPADQPIAAAANGVPDDCVQTLGGWEDTELSEGTLRFAIDGEAAAENFDLDELGEALGITPQPPTVDGDTAEIDFSSEEQTGPDASRVRTLLTRFVTGYDCG